MFFRAASILPCNCASHFPRFSMIFSIAALVSANDTSASCKTAVSNMICRSPASNSRIILSASLLLTPMASMADRAIRIDPSYVAACIYPKFGLQTSQIFARINCDYLGVQTHNYLRTGQCSMERRPQHCLNFLPDPQGQGSFRPRPRLTPFLDSRFNSFGAVRMLPLVGQLSASILKKLTFIASAALVSLGSVQTCGRRILNVR